MQAQIAAKRTVKDCRDSMDFGMCSRSLHLEQSSVLQAQARREQKQTLHAWLLDVAH